MALKIDKKLNLVLNVEREDGSLLHVHSTPIPHSVFERYFMVMSQAFNQIFAGGIGSVTGPRVAAMMLRRMAERSGEWEGPEGVEHGLMGEIRRLTNVSVPAPNGGWQVQPLDLVISQGLIEEEDLSEVMNAIVFFILVSSINRRQERATTLETLARFWGGQLVSSNITEFNASLRTSTPAESSGAKVTPSSMPT